MAFDWRRFVGQAQYLSIPGPGREELTKLIRLRAIAQACDLFGPALPAPDKQLPRCPKPNSKRRAQLPAELPPPPPPTNLHPTESGQGHSQTLPSPANR